MPEVLDWIWLTVPQVYAAELLDEVEFHSVSLAVDMLRRLTTTMSRSWRQEPS
jgi:hypothetical protein